VRRLFAVLIAVVVLSLGAVAYAATTALQSGKRAEHVLVEEYVDGGIAVGPGSVGKVVSCPQGFYATGGGYEFNGGPIDISYNGPAAGWGGVGTAWMAAGQTDVTGAFRVWAICIKLTG
jgi:hypothetical protein